MKYIEFLKKILNRKEKFNIIYISILMVMNTLFELMSIGIILPIVTILLKKDFDFLPENLHEFVKSLDYFDLVKKMYETRFFQGGWNWDRRRDFSEAR